MSCKAKVWLIVPKPACLRAESLFSLLFPVRGQDPLLTAHGVICSLDIYIWLLTVSFLGYASD